LGFLFRKRFQRQAVSKIGFKIISEKRKKEKKDTEDKTERRTNERKREREREMAMVYLLREWCFASREW